MGFLSNNQIGVFAFFLSVIGCAGEVDPATQAPVDPSPGLYEVSLGGAGVLKTMEREGPREYCLHELERGDFPHLLARNYYQLHALCRVERGARQGNAVSGEIICAADPKMARGSNRFVYAGAVASESARLEVRMKLDAELKDDAMSEAEAKQLGLGLKVMEKFRFTIDAQRLGECP